MILGIKTRTFAIILGAIIGVGLFSSCAPAAKEELFPLPEKNIALWVLPFDEYQPMSPILRDYQEARILRECIVGAGFNYPLDDIADVTRLPLPTSNSTGYRLFSPSIAAEWGYHRAWYDDELSRFGEKVESATYTAADDAQFEKCHNERPESLPDHDLMAINYAWNAAAVVWEETKATEAVLEAGAAWKACMAPLGISDLPNLPTDMLPPSLTPMLESETPSVEEIRVAVADAECRDSSGFTETFYTTEWDLQIAMLHEQEETFVQVKESNAAYEAGLLETLQNLGLQ